MFALEKTTGKDQGRRTMTHEVADERFRTKKELADRARSILYRHGFGVPIPEPDFTFLCGLLRRHPQSAAKVGPGVAAMTVEPNPVYPSSRGFWLTRTDGTRADFSYLECIRATGQKAKVRSACRAAVADQVVEFRRSHFREHAGPDGRVECPILGVRVSVCESHVDHRPPLTFERLLADFLAAEGIDAEEVGTTSEGDGEIGDRLADGDLERRWREFHRRHADLRVASAAGNTKQGRKAVLAAG
jgi:hypothetical protein